MESSTVHTTAKRVGLIVPSSNTTMETEIPAMLRAQGGEYTFHSSRMRMKTVSPDELKAMDAQGERCIQELCDARCDVIAYACLVAVMVQGLGAHRDVEQRLRDVAMAQGSSAPVISSAGALVDSLHAMGAKRIAVAAPYVPTLTRKVVDYLEAEGMAVVSVESLGIDDNYLVGRISGEVLSNAVSKLDLTDADVLVLSACVQMPSLPIVDLIERIYGIPVLTAATATASAILRSLGESTVALPGAVGV